MANDWPLWDTLEKLHRAAKLEVPATLRFVLIEVVDETAAEELLDLVLQLVDGGPQSAGIQQAVRAFDTIIDATHTYDLGRDWNTWPPVDPLGQLSTKKKARDLPKVLDRILANADLRRLVLTELLLGARAAGVLRERTGSDGWSVELFTRSDWVTAPTGEDAWARLLVQLPDALHATLARCHVLRKRRRARRIDLVRRLRDLKSAPKLKGLQRLIKDVRAVGGQTPSALRSALMLAARESGFAGRSLRSLMSWIEQNPAALNAVIDWAHCVAKTLPGRGRKVDRALQDYCRRVAEIFQALAGRAIGYITATDNSRSLASGNVYGVGLSFMHIAMRLVDPAVTRREAKREIDRLRGWVRKKARKNSKRLIRERTS